MHQLYAYLGFIELGLKKLLRFCIIGFRPLLGPAACRFPIGCTKYACNMLEEKRLFEALVLICQRLLSCNPLS